jgi:hypothetical protein
MNANLVTNRWNSLCPPAQIYAIVSIAIVLFNLYRGTYRHAITHGVTLVIGTTLLWVLCAANLQFAAYALLLLPVVFFLFLLALLFYDQSFFQITRSYTPGYEPGYEPGCEPVCEPDCEPKCHEKCHPQCD